MLFIELNSKFDDFESLILGEIQNFYSNILISQFVGTIVETEEKKEIHL